MSSYNKEIVWCGKPIGLNVAPISYKDTIDDATSIDVDNGDVIACRNITDADIVIKRTNGNSTLDYLTIKRCAPDRLYVKYNSTTSVLFNNGDDIWNKELAITGDTMKQQDGLFSVMKKDDQDLLSAFTFSTSHTYNAAYALKTESAITDNMFANCTNVVEVGIPSSVKKIGNGAFSGCTNLITYTPVMNTYSGDTSVDNPSPATCQTLMFAEEIGKSAFRNCEKLSEIKIGGNVKAIGEYAFALSPSSIGSATTITFENIKPDDGGTLANTLGIPLCFCFYRKSLNTTKFIYNDNIGQDVLASTETFNGLKLPNGVTSISANAFYYCSGFTRVEIPDSVTSIGEQAFQGCSSLTSITIPDSVSDVGRRAFYQCSNISSCTIGNGVESIGEGTFGHCGLTSITFNNGSQLQTIGKQAFTECTGLTSIIIPSSVTSIGEQAFYSATSLNSITLEGRQSPTSPTTLTTAIDAFSNVSSGGTLHVPNATSQEDWTAWTTWGSTYLPGWTITT